MLAAPEAHQFACLDKSTTRLLPVRCELWRGLVFINLDPDAAPLAEFMAPALTYTQGFPLEDLVLRSEEHTSELQSLMRISYAVFCLKKKNNIHTNVHNI